MDNPTPWIVTDEIWDYVIEPHIVDILLGRGWSLTSNTDETMVFYKLNVGDVPHYSDVIRPITRGMIEDARTEKEDRKRSERKKKRSSTPVRDTPGDLNENPDNTSRESPRKKKRDKKKKKSRNDRN
eukprot:TRINITY_DN711_c3_g1_i2.p1 TRINITY_DN711_c3_g1~~TRINITY_DN711_c3_g1_i2.p1  ORF type:complete len:127 (+),score=33.66 TRINITY_DN711_c3_g1_i2:366-746(+)